MPALSTRRSRRAPALAQAEKGIMTMKKYPELVWRDGELWVRAEKGQRLRLAGIVEPSCSYRGWSAAARVAARAAEAAAAAWAAAAARRYTTYHATREEAVAALEREFGGAGEEA